MAGAADGGDKIVERLGELANIQTKVLTQLEQNRAESIEAGKKLDERLVKLEARGKRTAPRSAYLDALRSEGKTEEEAVDVEERIERAVAAVEVDHVVHGGQRIPVIRSMPRGLAGVRDGRGLVAMRMIRMMAIAQAAGENTIDAALSRAHKLLGPNDPATVSLEEQRDMMKRAVSDKDFSQRALGTQNVGNGALFVAPQYAATFVDFLFASSILGRLGCFSLPMSANGGEVILFLDTAMAVGFREEGGGQNESSPQEGSMNVLRRILSGTLAINNELLEEASYAVDAIMRTHMGRAMMARKDKAGMLGRGAQNEIRGMDWWVELPTSAHYANRSLATGNVTVQTVLQDFANGVGRITSENKALYADEGARPACALADRDVRGLAIASEGSGGAISRPFKDEIAGGSICGLPLGRTNQLPLTLAGDGAGSGTNNKSKGFIFDASSVGFYEKDGMRVEAFRGGAYKDAAGVMQSGVDKRQTVITGDMDFDFVDLYRGKSIARIDSIDWGPAFGVTV